MNNYITVIGGGLAGTEAAYQIAKHKIKVKLYEMKPNKYTPAHTNKNLAEIVCSNSFKSNLHTNACGLLKEELRSLDSLLIRTADETAVPAGQALAVDRELFSKKVTEEIEKNPYIEIINKEVGDEISLEDLSKEGIVIVATGPLTSEKLSKEIINLTGENNLAFYDAAAPIVTKESIDFDIAFFGNRYEQEKQKEETIEAWKERLKQQEASYINLPMNQEEYLAFVKELILAEVTTLHDFEKREIFEGCMPIEIMAKRGIDTLRYGPLKPVGFDDPRYGKRPYAVVQLRQDDYNGTIYNIVGFQTNLKFGEQKRVFSLIPGLQNAEFVKYGVMHRNTYINSTKLLDETYNFKENKNIYFAGQITGVEGYVESISSGLVSAINAIKRYEEIEKEETLGKEVVSEKREKATKKVVLSEKREKATKKVVFSEYTMIGALAKYISTPNNKFQPMNANFGILPELCEKIKDKKLKYQKLADRAEEYLKRDIDLYLKN